MDEGTYQVENTGPVQGQNVGDHLQITQTFYGPGSMPSSGQRATSPVPTNLNRQRMLKRVRSIWISGLLEQSLHGATLIALGLQGMPDALADPWRLVVQEIDHPAQPLSAGTRITEVYDEADGALLILGEPGAGKTTLLLELARDLLTRAQADEREPIPVVFTLSSWAQKRAPMADWLVEELYLRYQVPRTLGRTWMDNDQVLPLLDGLDEVASEHRAACVDAINAYRQEHGLLPTVVCSRHLEYEDLAKANHILQLHNAVVVQPLTLEQIDDYLTSAGEQIAAVRVALHDDPVLQRLATTPLMLNVLILTYRGVPLDEITEGGSAEARQKQLLASYVQHMLKRRGVETHYKPEQTIHWLGQVARQMSQQNQTIFYLERMQLAWLPEDRSRWLYRNITIRLFPGLLPGLLLGFYTWLNSTSLVNGLLVGLVASLLFMLMRREGKASKAAEVVVWSWTRVWRNLGKGLLVGFGSGVLAWLLSAPHLGQIMGLDIGLVEWLDGGIFSGLLFELIEGTETEIKPVEVVHWSWRGARRGLGRGLLVGLLLAGLLYGPFIALLFGLFYESYYGLIVGLISGLIVGLLYGLPFGLLVMLAFGLFSGLSSGILDEHKRLTPNQGIWDSARNSVRVGLVSGLIAGLLFGLSFFLLFGLSYYYMLVGGLSYGVIVGMAFGLRGGGMACIQHSVLRVFLWRAKSIPWNYSHFLNYADERVLLRKVGGGYIFIHRLLLDYFASLSPTVPTSVEKHATHHEH